MSNSRTHRSMSSRWLPLAILGLACPLAGCEGDPAHADEDADGFTAAQGDCNDQDRAVHPGSLEVCNGFDDDCNGSTDEVEGTLYADTDGDGFGDASSPTENTCTPPDGYVADATDCDDTDRVVHPGVQLCSDADTDCDGRPGTEDLDSDGVLSCLDCDDNNAAVQPGVADASGDAVDSDCGGTDDADPSVGLPNSTFTRIQDAVSAAAAGSTVWVGPGTYLEANLSFGGKALALRSTRGEAVTVIDAQQTGRVVSFTSGEGLDTAITGFTLTGGAIPDFGGAVYAESSSPTLAHLVITGNAQTVPTGDSYVGGGGIALISADPVIAYVQVTGNSAVDSAGGIGMLSSNPTLTHVDVSDNMAHDAGGVGMSRSDPVMTHVTISGNTAEAYDEASAWGGFAGGVVIDDSSPLLNHVTIADNFGGFGGGVFVYDSSPTFQYVSILNNTSEEGGGINIWSGSMILDHVVMVGNSASSGGAIAMVNQPLVLTNSIIAYNMAGTGGNLNLAYDAGAGEDSSQVLISSSVLYNPPGATEDYQAPSGSYLTVEPGFLAYADTSGAACTPGTDYACLPVDLHLAQDSALIDAGAGDQLDPDGSAADPGIYGGSGGAGWDRDADGAFDWFWPGDLADAPAGFNPDDYDMDDEDSSVR